MKLCYRCKKRPRVVWPSGRIWAWCRECGNELARAYNHTPARKAWRKAYAKSYNQTPARKALQKARNKVHNPAYQRGPGREAHNRAAREWARREAKKENR